MKGIDMKREMLFRGKRVDTNEWVEGPGINTQYDISGKEHVYIGVFIASTMYPTMCTMRNIEWFEVIIETVCQFTGMTDRNSRKIFEDDIVRAQERYDRPYSKNRKSKRHVGVVKYHIARGTRFYNKETKEFDRHSDYAAEYRVIVKDYGKYVHGSWGDFYDCEVIGNIHDNPELLEEVDNVQQ